MVLPLVAGVAKSEGAIDSSELCVIFGMDISVADYQYSIWS